MNQVNIESFNKQKKRLRDWIISHGNVRGDTRQPLPIIDPLIYPLVDAINSCSFLCTTQSCQGHISKDIHARQIFNGEPGSNPAHVQFLSTRRFTRETMKEISNLAKIRFREEWEKGEFLYEIWWDDTDTTKGITKLVKFFRKLSNEGPDRELHRIVRQSAWIHPRWMRKAFEKFGKYGSWWRECVNGEHGKN